MTALLPGFAVQTHPSIIEEIFVQGMKLVDHTHQMPQSARYEEFSSVVRSSFLLREFLEVFHFA
jgi:hypothetical protein